MKLVLHVLNRHKSVCSGFVCVFFFSFLTSLSLSLDHRSFWIWWTRNCWTIFGLLSIRIRSLACPNSIRYKLLKWLKSFTCWWGSTTEKHFFLSHSLYQCARTARIEPQAESNQVPSTRANSLRHDFYARTCAGFISKLLKYVIINDF